MRGILLLLVTSVALAGCTGPGGLGEPSLDVTGHAVFHLDNRDNETYRLQATATLTAGEVDEVSGSVPANGTATLEVGVPGEGNVQLRLANVDTGKEAQATLSASSCDTIRIDVVIEDGAPRFDQTHCR